MMPDKIRWIDEIEETHKKCLSDKDATKKLLPEEQ